MKRSIQHISLLGLLFLITLSGCKKEETFSDYNNRKGNILGAWKAEVKYEYNQKGHNPYIFKADTFTSWVDTFFDDNSGKMRFSVYTTQDSRKVSWYYQYQPEKVVVSYNEGGFVVNSIEYTITNNTKDYQEWTAIYENDVRLDDTLVIDAVCKETRKMTRM